MPAPAAEAPRWEGVLLGAALGVAIAAVVARAVMVLATAIGVIDFPASLDYGEGIVIEQANLIGAGAGYGDVTVRPHIVFHYPPVYHAAVLAASGLVGDPVTAGRLVSVLSALVMCCCVGTLVAAALGREIGRGARAAGTVAGAGLVFVSPAVAEWVPLARVDMLAMAFSFIGLVLVAPRGCSLARIAAAALCFVLAGFTKQTAIAALGGATLVLLVQDRGRALALLAMVAMMGFTGLGIGHWATDGRFLQHIVAFNVNRYSLGHLAAQLVTIVPTATLAVLPVAAIILHREGRRLRDEAGVGRSRAFAMLAVQFALCTAMLPLVGKFGSNHNYFIEWYLAGAALGGIAVGEIAWRLRHAASRTRVQALACTILAGGVALQVGLVPPASEGTTGWRRDAAAVAREVVAAMGAAPGDVLSDDMVLLLRSGRRVLLEPAIFAELTSIGRWDESLLTGPLRDGRIGLLVTEAPTDDYLFHVRYTPSIRRAIDAALPRKDRIGWLVLHRPADPP